MRRPQRWSSYVTHNGGLKLLSLLLALALYLAITSQPSTEVGLNVPLEYRNVPASLEITNEQIPQVHVRLRGPADLVRRASQTDVVAFIDLTGATAGTRTFDLSRGAVHAPYGLAIVDLSPSQFRLQLEPRATRVLPVVVRTVGNVAAGHVVTGVHVTPAQVQVSGPASHVQSLSQVQADSVDVSGKTHDITVPTHIYVPDAQVHLDGGNAAHVHVSIGRGH